MSCVMKSFSLLFCIAVTWSCSQAGQADRPAIADASAVQTGCQAEPADLAGLVQGIAAELSAQEILYDSEPLSDCSGMFHRVLQAFDERCPGHSLPDHRSARDSRAIGRWYAEKSLFTPITDALAQADLIRPGSVMFYGQPGRRYENVSLEDALGEIEHIGIVVLVQRDDGKVVGYHLFHGRSPGKCAGITEYHQRDPDRDGWPPLGNWDQQWIGVAPVGV